MAKGNTFVQEYEVNAKHIQKSYNNKFCIPEDDKGTNKTPKKKKRKK